MPVEVDTIAEPGKQLVALVVFPTALQTGLGSV